ncbi:endopeptidase La [Coriobacteriia bacterium Es71-Z0120]|uniref:endopeptidase La n=1 Tax=Parvivirga hydrogeniphila TaxID=2939460 RepID=UPI002260CDCF|nr:endopeptidase La [Parvivirga hydrogeniphila]MCL4078367.1 endopeptidase La [Parvivirga hydrogeniphila]
MSEKDEQRAIPEVLPLIPLRDLVLFPNLVVPLFVGRERSVNALEQAMRADHLVALATQREAETQEPDPDDIHSIGCVVSILQELKLPDGTAKALVEGIKRVRIVEYLRTDPYMEVRIEPIEEAAEADLETEALMRNLVADFERAAQLGKPIPQEVLIAANGIEEPGRLADFVAFHLSLKTEEKQQILEAIDPKQRLSIASEFLRKELEILELGSRIQSRVKESMTKTQREYFLREQLKAIQQELGQYDEMQAEIEEYKQKIEAAGMPEAVKEKALKELGRLEKMPQAAAETAVIRSYLDWLVGLPWQVVDEEKLDLNEAQKILDEDHYGLEKVKERVLEYLAVHKLTDHMRGPILCFVGPPGVGKTSIGKSIARALNRKFVRMSLGGVRDEAEIRGHRRTYVGALPGRIIQSISQAGTRNPVFMMDEIDKVGVDFRGDPTAALLEVLDPEQNNAFQDHYLEAPFDLSDVMFITTANLLDTIPPALRDRMEVIHFPGYTEEEKLQIAKRYLIPRQVKEHGLNRKLISISDPAVREIIRRYTREAGVRNLERSIAAICRQVARNVVEGRTEKTSVTVKNVHEFLGPAKFSFGLAEKRDEVGVATGLVWTEVGGDVIFVEATTMKGSGKLILTGQLGEVMRESAQAAVSYIRSKASELGIDPEFNEKLDIHIHVPAAAIPKDGPSAGITMATALVSVLTGRPARREVAMTGEITLRGHVLPIGGLKEKLLAAHRAGIKKVIIPKENLRDLELVPEHARTEMEVVPVERMSEVLEHALKPGSRATRT